MKKILILLSILLINTMAFGANLQEMTGQMILVGFKGTDIHSREYKIIKKQLERGDIGGVIIYEFNVKDKAKIETLTKDLLSTKSKFKPFIGIDQEGGIVHILGEENGFKNHPSANKIANSKSLKETYKIYDDMAKMLNDSGFNLNFAPCVDLLINKNSIIAKKERSYSKNPTTVSRYAEQFINANYNNNVISSIKHFPGHGSPTGDTHLGFVDASNTWSPDELIPYKKLANKNDLEMVMASHIFIKQLDKKYPASLSKNIIEGILRKQIGFDGVVITDDLHMGAISKNYSLEEIVTKSINAGCDILLFSNYDNSDMKTPKKVQKIVENKIKNGEIEISRIEKSYDRITKLKKNLQKHQDATLFKNLNYEKITKKYQGKTPKCWGENTKGVITKIKTDEKIIALTLDACGSKNDSLDENLITFLEKEKIPATLFINGRWIKKYPEKFARLAKNPLFEIENHGIRHCPASINGKSIYGIQGTKNVPELIAEINENGLFIEKLTGRKPIFFRSGTAYYDEYATQIANDLGYGVMGFSILGDRGATYTKKQVTNALLKAKPGDIIICHMNHPEKETGKGLINVLPILKKKGFKFVKLEDYRNLLY